MIKSGQVAVIKTTDEPVFILGVKKFTEFPPELNGFDCTGIATGEIVMVRRPVMTKQGIQHLTEQFFIEEIEAIDAKRARLTDEYTKYLAEQKLGQAEPIDVKPSTVN